MLGEVKKRPKPSQPIPHPRTKFQRPQDVTPPTPLSGEWGVGSVVVVVFTAREMSHPSNPLFEWEQNNGDWSLALTWWKMTYRHCIFSPCGSIPGDKYPIKHIYIRKVVTKAHGNAPVVPGT